MIIEFTEWCLKYNFDTKDPEAQTHYEEWIKIEERKLTTIAHFKGKIEWDDLKKYFPTLSGVQTMECSEIRSSSCIMHGIDVDEYIHYDKRYDDKNWEEKLMGRICCMLFDTSLATIKKIVAQLQTWITKVSPEGEHCQKNEVEK